MTMLRVLNKRFLSVMLMTLTIACVQLGAQWSKIGDAPAGIGSISIGATVAVGNTIYVIGGQGTTALNQGIYAFDVTNPSAGWTRKVGIPTVRLGCCAAVNNGKIYIAGGFAVVNNARQLQAALLEYDPVANTVTAKANMPTPVWGGACAVVGDRLYVMNGVTNASALAGNTQVYRFSTNTWSSGTTTPSARYFPSLVATGDSLYLIGGEGQNGGLFTIDRAEVNTATGALVWESLNDFGKPAIRASAAAYNGSIYLAGGNDENGVAQFSVGKYNTQTNEWSSTYGLETPNFQGGLVAIGTSLYSVLGSSGIVQKLTTDNNPRAIANISPTSFSFIAKPNGTATFTGTTTIANKGIVDLLCTLKVAQDTPWLKNIDNTVVSVPAGEVQTFDFLADQTGLAINSYTATPSFTTNDPLNPTVGCSVILTVASGSYPRLPLLEVFTSSTCPPCKPGNENLDNVLKNYTRSQYTVLKFQQDFPGTGDPYATVETINHRNFYGINSIPRMEVDGGWDGNATSFTSELLDVSKDITAFVNPSSTYTVSDKKVTVNVDVNSYAPIPPGFRLYCAVLEKRTVRNIKSNGETQFTEVVKKMLPDEKGIDLGAIPKGASPSRTLEYTFPGNYRLPSSGSPSAVINLATEHSVENFANLEVITWIQNPTTLEVLNSSWGTNSTSSVENGNTEITSNHSILNVFPNPTQSTATVTFNTPSVAWSALELYNIRGEKVALLGSGVYTMGLNSVSFDVSSLPSGSYTVWLKSGNQQSGYPISIVR